MKKLILILGIIVAAISLAQSQQLLIDKGTRASGLWCFPLLDKPNEYVYLPSRARLALNQDSLPEFSFMRYVMEKENGQSSTINQAGGGGILHFLVLYDTPAEMIENAEYDLQRKFDNDQILIRGPVVFESCRYALISSVINDQDEREKVLLTRGEAPVLENSKIALSFELDRVKSKIMLESFKMATPDLSLAFEMVFDGLTDSYQAELEVDWSEIYNSQSYGAGGSVYFVGADVKAGFENLKKNNNIRFTAVGSNANMESLVQTVYDRLLTLVFEEVPTELVPENEQGGLEDAIAGLISSDGLLGSRNTTGFGLNVSYKIKMRNTTGKGRLEFNGRSNIKRTHFITFNIGDLYSRYGDNEKVFKDVPLWDPAFQQREVFVGVDGTLEKEFNKLVNSVTVRIKKDHENGVSTTKELIVDKNLFLDSLGKLSMTYLNQKDQDRLQWLQYNYQTVWQFAGGGYYQTSWDTTNAAMINLFVPYKRKNITLEGDPDILQQNNVRAVSVSIKYPFFSEEKSERITIRSGEELSGKKFQITLPNSEETVDYTVTWVKNDGTRPSFSGSDDFGMIFIDEMPQP